MGEDLGEVECGGLMLVRRGRWATGQEHAGGSVRWHDEGRSGWLR